MRQNPRASLSGLCVRWRRQHPAVEMTHSASASHLGSEFDDFLYAPIREDRNGMLLSVLSALARSDVDPWQEAARLAGLPVETARQRLASLIAALPGKPSVYPDPSMIAARLVALLPRRADPEVPSRKTLPSAGAATHRRAVMFVYAIFIVIALGVQWIAVSHQLSAPASNDRAPASSTVSPQVHPPISGR